MQQSIDTPLIVLSLILIHASAAVFIFYRPKDMLPHTYDPLKWIAAVSGLFGIFILANYVTALCCLILAVAYPLAYKQCYTDIDIPQGFAEIVMEGAAVSVLAWALSFALRPIPFSASILVLALIVYFICRVYAAYYRAEKINDDECKKILISNQFDYFYALARLLARHYPKRYPPFIQRCMEICLEKYARFIRDLNKVNGNILSDLPDFDIVRSELLYFTITSRSIPAAWNLETTARFFNPIFDILNILTLCADLTPDEQTKSV